MEEIIKVIKDEYPKMGLNKTAIKLNISLYKLRKIIKSNNIILGDKIRKVSIENFNNITKKEVSYFLGFFWSDGYISRDEITICIKSSDGQEIFNILNKFGDWRINNRIKKLNGKEFEQITIRINDKYIKKFLLENDYGNKSLTTPTKILSNIKDELKPYFFRGLIDGDGCFCSKNRNYFSITGDLMQDWYEVENLLKSLDINYSLTKKTRNTGNSSYVVISSKIDIIKLGEYIYSEYDGIGLTRKYDIYNEIKNKPITSKISKKYNRHIDLS
jgi:intein/homing endonuclease